jgi:hypothetical protein
MATMYSADDPVFFLHHCNIDRLWHLWMDCHDYEKLTVDQLTETQYVGINPVFGNTPRVDPVSQKPLSVGLNDQIYYYWQSDNYSLIFPPEKWPTPADLWGLGTEDSTGWDGIYYRYGPDLLVMLSATQANCEGKDWAWVNSTGPEGTQEKSSSKPEEFFNTTKITDMVESIDYTFESKLQFLGNIDPQQALTELAMEACDMTAPIEMTDYVREWLEMNGIVPEEALDALRVCGMDNWSDMGGMKWLTGSRSRKRLRAVVGTVKEKMPIIISGSVIAIILVVVVIFILKKNRDNSNPTNQE